MFSFGFQQAVDQGILQKGDIFFQNVGNIFLRVSLSLSLLYVTNEAQSIVLFSDSI